MIARVLITPKAENVESLVNELLPQAIQNIGGISERLDSSLEIAIQPANADKFALSDIERLTAFKDQIDSTNSTWVSFAHPLIQNYADVLIEEAPVEILNFTSIRKAPPQRVIEKLEGILHTRPTKIELSSVSETRRIWVHSLFLLNLESIDRGHQLQHALQNIDGDFIHPSINYLSIIENRMLEFDIERLKEVPPSMRQAQLTWSKSLDISLFQSLFEKEVSALKFQEMDTALRYFDKLRDDLNDRIGKIKLAPYIGKKRTGSEIRRLVETLEAKVAHVDLERNQRMRAIEERYQSQFSVQPVGARIFILPTYNCQFQIGSTQRYGHFTVMYCPVLREFFPPNCAKCQKPSWDLVLQEADVICGKCC